MAASIPMEKGPLGGLTGSGCCVSVSAALFVVEEVPFLRSGDTVMVGCGSVA